MSYAFDYYHSGDVKAHVFVMEPRDEQNCLAPGRYVSIFVPDSLTIPEVLKGLAIELNKLQL